MFDSTEAAYAERGPSARHLVLIFLASVAVCAVFFSLGYLVGYNEKGSKSVLVTENVPEPAAIPPTVNPPAKTAAALPSSEPQSAANAPASSPVLQTIEKPEPLPSPKVTAAAKRRAAARSKRSAAKSAMAARTPAKKRAHAYAGAGYSIQVMASRTKADAKSLVNLLRGRGYPAFVLSAQAVNAPDHLFRVLVGPYTGRAQAEVTLKKLQKEGFEPFIKH